MKTRYGIDAPGIILSLLILGVLGFALNGLWRDLSPLFFVPAALMLLYSTVGKYRLRNFLMAKVPWRGDERVLDIGCGRGLLLAGAAQHLKSGRAMGIDLWSGKDLSQNTPDETRRLLELEGVSDRAEVLTGDATSLPFADESFDIIFSNLTLHNIPEAAGRKKACEEIARVLKPGGEALISDFQKLNEFVQAFKDCGLQVEVGPSLWRKTFFPIRILRAKKI